MDPAFAKTFITIGSWLLIAMGLAKMMIYLIGELLPGVYSKIKSEKTRKFMTGTGNRIVFGLLGFVTVLIGAFFLLLGNILFRFLEQTRL